MDNQRPHACKQDTRIAGIHGYFKTAGIFIYKQDLLPGFASITCFVNAPLLLGPVTMPHSCYQYYIGVLGMNHNPADSPRFFEAHVFPGFAGICGAVNTVAD